MTTPDGPMMDLFAELLELSRDVTDDPELRRRRLAALRRLERRLQGGERSSQLLIA